MKRRSLFDTEEIETEVTEEINEVEKDEKVKKVKVDIDNYNLRTGPGFEYKSKGFIAPGEYTIISEENGFGKIEDDLGWIFLGKVKFV